MKNRHKITEVRIRNVCRIVEQHYENGNQSKCYKAVWRNYVYPVYPVCYHTFLNYINTPLIAGKPLGDKQQLTLFDDESK